MIWQELRRRMLHAPGQTVTEGSRVLTYRGMVRMAEKLAGTLNEPAYAILCRSELQAAIALLACLAAGRTAVPLSYRYGEVHAGRILKSVCPAGLLTDKNGALAAEPYDPAGYRPPEKPPALILCTSGTTGTPKGAMIREENLLCNLQDIDAYFSIGPADAILITRPLYHCAVLTGEFLISLWKGARIRFFPDAFNPPVLCDAVCRDGITVLGGTPTLFGHLCRAAARRKEPLPLRTAAVSGECLTEIAAARIRAALPDTAIYHVYGLTEASPRVAYLPPSLFDRFPSSVGYPLRSLSVCIADGEGRPLPPDTDGELLVRGPSVMQGYFQNPGATARALRDGWLHTGDIASISQDGRITIRCRKDNMIIHAGLNIYPQEIENALKAETAIRDVLAYGIPDPLCGQRIGLQVVGGLSRQEVALLCRRLLPPYEQPGEIHLVDELPRNGSGKLIRSRKVETQ